MPVSASIASVGAATLSAVTAYGSVSRPSSVSVGLVSGPAVAAPVVAITATAGWLNVPPRYLSVVEAYLQNINCPPTARYPLVGQRGHSACEII